MGKRPAKSSEAADPVSRHQKNLIDDIVFTPDDLRWDRDRRHV